MSERAERLRLTLLADTRNRWLTKAKEATSETAYQYACNRVRSLSTWLGPRLVACGKVSMDIACRCGPKVVARGCRQWWLCGQCRNRRSATLRRRLASSIAAQWNAAQRGGYRVGLRMLTLTARDTGDPVADRRALGDAWRAFYKRSREWLGAYPYALVWEVTPGAAGTGHVHGHAVVIWPRWVAWRGRPGYGRARELWIRATDHKSNRLNIIEVTGGAAGAASYLAKYLSKGVDGATFNDALTAGVLAAFYNQRAVTTSWRFWCYDRGCKCCGALHWRTTVNWLGELVPMVSASDRRELAARARALDHGPECWCSECVETAAPLTQATQENNPFGSNS